MSPKKTIVWVLVAGGLFAFIFFSQRHRRLPVPAPVKVLSALNPESVSSISIRPSGPGQLQIRFDRTNGTWQLTQPLLYPAQSESINKLLSFLEELTPNPYISGSELRAHPNGDDEFGFTSPQATIVLQQGGYMPRIRVGASTAPGDQVFLQVEGDLGAYVVSADLLKMLPKSPNDWRDTTLLDLRKVAFTRLMVTNNAKGDPGRGGLPASSATFVLQREGIDQAWRMSWPLDARANASRIESALQKLQNLRIRQFVSDDPKADLEPFGLAPTELELGFANGSNSVGLIQFGHSVSNGFSKVYARRAGQVGVFAVERDLLLSWCALLNDFRDPYLLGPLEAVDSIEFTRGDERSSVQRQSDGGWKITPGNFASDLGSVENFLSGLTNLAILKFVNDVANPADLPQYGLAPPFERVTLRGNSAGATVGSSTPPIAEIDFGLGTNASEQIYARRTDESFVYAIGTNAFSRLPGAAWQLRERKLCRFPLAEVASLTLRAQGKKSQLIRKAPLNWAFAPGSQGVINDGAIEETVRGVTQVAAIAWSGRGKDTRSAFGFRDDGLHVILEPKTGDKFDLEFGGVAASGNIYAGLMLEGEFWVLEFPWIMFRDIEAYLPLQKGG
jgi:hypothetical protein